MAVTLGYSALRDALGMTDAIRLLEEMLSHEAAGRTAASPKFSTDFENGSMRILFAADYEAGYCAMKAYHTIKGAGVRYLVTLYRLRDGELLALLDGSVITDLRTGAASGVVARRVAVKEPITVGVIGSGTLARTQLESLACVYRIASAAVFSPTPTNREAYASDMSAKLKIPMKVAETAQDAVRGRSVVVTASNSRSEEPVLQDAWLDRCRLLCAVGNTRSQFSELDVKCFTHAALVVADTEHAFGEAGEFKRAFAAGVLPTAKRATLAQLVSGTTKVPRDGLVLFKSVGSALQDLALAGRYYELLGERAGVPTAPDLARVRQSVAKRTDRSGERAVRRAAPEA
jgi:ornithine cyclodeaminase/alanine dehydrogenase-like protein (mu-crystallin family)